MLDSFSSFRELLMNGMACQIRWFVSLVSMPLIMVLISILKGK